jgi:hypothetical protein
MVLDPHSDPDLYSAIMLVPVFGYETLLTEGFYFCLLGVKPGFS